MRNLKTLAFIAVIMASSAAHADLVFNSVRPYSEGLDPNETEVSMWFTSDLSTWEITLESDTKNPGLAITELHGHDLDFTHIGDLLGLNANHNSNPGGSTVLPPVNLISNDGIVGNFDILFNDNIDVNEWQQFIADLSLMDGSHSSPNVQQEYAGWEWTFMTNQGNSTLKPFDFGAQNGTQGFIFSSRAASVPEPASTGIIAFLALTAAVSRRRRRSP